MGSVQAKLNSIEYRLAEQSTEANRQRVVNALDADPELAGKWRTTNNDPEFISWLNQTDDFAGHPEVAALDEGIQRRRRRSLRLVFQSLHRIEDTAAGADRDPATP
jgi:hypothetical protein